MKKALFLLISLFIVQFSFAQDFVISNYDIKIDVYENGSFDVEEIIEANFYQQKRGIYRKIPYQYKVDGKRYEIDIKDLRVDQWASKKYKEGKDEVLRIGKADEFISGRQEYVIRYSIEDAILSAGDYIEFYWNVIGEEWETDIQNASFEIHFPKEEDLLEYKLFAGNKRSDHGKVLLSQKGASLYGETLRNLSSGDGVSVAVKLPVGALQVSNKGTTLGQGTSRTQAAKEDQGVMDWLAAIPAAILAMFLQFWRRRGRNNISFEPLEDVAYPPNAMSAAEAGSRIDFRVNNRDLYALIPQWGREGYIRITGPYEVGRFKNPELYVERLKNLPIDFPEHEHLLFDALFEDKDIVLLSSLENKFFSKFSKAKTSLKKELQLKDTYDPEAYKLFHGGRFVVLGLLFLALGLYIIIAFGLLWTAITFWALSILCWVIQFSPPKKKEDALRTQQDLKDFKWFLEKAPENKLKAVVDKDPNYFDNVYPYVVAFGIDKLFIKRVEPYMEYGPTWYYYGDHMGRSQRAPMNTFSDQFKVSSVSSAFTSQPGSSGSGSSTTFSSGSSGGGFGGGGGGSW